MIRLLFAEMAMHAYKLSIDISQGSPFLDTAKQLDKWLWLITLSGNVGEDWGEGRGNENKAKSSASMENQSGDPMRE